MKFDEALVQVTDLLQRESRISYRALKIRFQLDDEYLEAIKDELIAAKRLAVDEDGKVLVWAGASLMPSSNPQAHNSTLPMSGERRQLTVMFCDLVGSTALSARLDPEELREVVQAYQQTCATIIRRHEGYVAQYLGDGLLIYFGYPVAQEDAARQAVQAGLEILAAMQRQNIVTDQNTPLQVRIGIHTGLVVVGEIGGEDRREQLALGETPNLAARLQGIAAPDTVVISAATARLVHGYFTVQALEAQSLKGIDQPLVVYRVLRESGLRSRLQVARTIGLTPLVAREREVGLLLERWAQVKGGGGQGVLICGEPGIGKSRLVQTLTEQVMAEPHARLVCRGSPYHRHSALYPVIDLLERVLEFQRDDSPEQKLDKLTNNLAQFSSLSPDMYARIASLLSLPTARFSLSPLPPQRLRQKTLEALLAWLWRARINNPCS